MRALIVSTTGTTAFTNPYAEQISEAKLRRWANQEARGFQGNAVWERELAGEIVRVWGRVGPKFGRVPAEISSLARLRAYCGIDPGDGSRFVFVASATEEGKAAARVCLHACRLIFEPCACPEGEDGQCQHLFWEFLPNVQPYDHARFAVGVQSLRDLLIRHRRSFREEDGGGHWLMLNITGGYKGVVPWATEYANELEFWLAYLYEESEHLILKKSRALEPLPEPRGA